MKSGVGRNSGPPSTRLLRSRSLLVHPLPHLQFRHRAHGVLLLAQHPPSNIRGGEEVQYRPPTPLVRQEVPDLSPALPPSGLLPHLRPQYLLLGLPLRTLLEEVLPSLVRVPAPPALWGGSVLRPVEVLPRYAVPCLELVEP